MADYRELLRRAVDALPENTGANRRAVYEKARSALVSQLRAIEPPLPAREITTHRLNLEDCIREVEHEATEKLLGRFKDMDEGTDTPEGDDAEPLAGTPVGDEPEAPAVEEGLAGEPEPEIEAEPESPVTGTEDVVEDDAQAAVQAAIEAERDSRYDEADVEADSATQEPEAEFPSEAEPSGPEPAPEGPDTVSEEETVPFEESVPASEYDAPEPVEPDFEPETGEESGPNAESDQKLEEEAPADETEVRSDFGDDFGPGPDTTDRSDDDTPSESASESGPYGAQHSIEDIIAQAQASVDDGKAGDESDAFVEPPSLADEDGGNVRWPEPEDERKVVPFSGANAADTQDDTAQEPQRGHFFASSRDAEPRADVPLVDPRGKPLSDTDGRPSGEAGAGQAMSSVREVELEPGAGVSNDLSDAQVTIDRAIAALDREARGEDTGEDGEAGETSAAGDGDTADGNANRDDKQKSGFGPLTVFLLIAILLLGGGGAAGYWAWREGYIDLDQVFAQGEPAQSTEVAEAEPEPEPSFTEEEAPAEPEPEPRLPVEGANTTEQVPAPADVTADEESGEVPEDPVTETETPNVEGAEPDVGFEERLPAEAGTPEDEDAAADEEGVEIAAGGPQSLLLEEQASGTAGAVPYTGEVTWSRGTDELGHPTIEATASIPARNLDVEVLLRRNADSNLPASHLMEINFTVAESFVGGSIANLPGVLLKDEELVQGQPLTGASARIVGNSFLFALSGASEQDIANNVELLEDQSWVDLAMVYGTGRRAILTLEKGEEGEDIFAAVLADWAELDAEAAAGDDTSDDAAADSPA